MAWKNIEATAPAGLKPAAPGVAAEVIPEGWGSRFLLKTPAGAAWTRIGRPGPFNVGNALATAAIGLAAGLELKMSPASWAWVGPRNFPSGI